MADDHEHCCEQPFEKSGFRVFGKLRLHIFVCSDGKDFCGCEAAGGGALLAALRQELVRRRLMARRKITSMQCRQQGAAGPGHRRAGPPCDARLRRARGPGKEFRDLECNAPPLPMPRLCKGNFF
jgi:hypothetical protein